MIKGIKKSIGNIGVRLIKFTARKAKIDLIRLAYWENGLLKSHSLEASGEAYFIKQFLPQHLKTKQPTILDIGANKGEYSLLLHQVFPDATIYAFEPNPNTFKVLSDNIQTNVNLINKGIGASAGELELFYDKEDKTSVQATSDPEILKVIAGSEQITSSKIEVITLDEFSQSESIQHIDLLKIDTEGFELEALMGAKQLLEQKAIGIVQFEFNEVNIVKRRFLRDFYELLEGFSFYRLDERRLIPLEDWKPIHEIFMFQNIIAIRQ